MKIFSGKEERGYQKILKIFKKEIEQLERFGYYSFQVKDLLGKYIKQDAFTKEDEENIRKELQKQIDFAKKAMQSIS